MCKDREIAEVGEEEYPTEHHDYVGANINGRSIADQSSVTSAIK
jgi:hypothetical protein